MKKLMAVTLIVWAELMIPVHGQAHVRMWQPEVLKGLKAVRLDVERIKPEIERRFPRTKVILQLISLTSAAHMGPCSWGVAFLPENCQGSGDI